MKTYVVTYKTRKIELYDASDLLDEYEVREKFIAEHPFATEVKVSEVQ